MLNNERFRNNNLYNTYQICVLPVPGNPNNSVIDPIGIPSVPKILSSF